MAIKLNRKAPVRISLVVLTVALYLVTLYIVAVSVDLDQVQVFDLLKWIIGVIGAAIAGDTWRPSGHAKPAMRVAASE